MDDADQQPQRGSAWWASLLLVVAFVLGFALVSSVVVVRGRLLDADLYAEALVRTDAYERTYTDVLADPELAELTDHLLGDVGPERLDPTQARTLATAALRLGVPPSTLRDGTETFVGAVLAYVRGDTPRLDGDLDVTGVVDRVDEAATVWAQTLATAADDRVTTSVAGFRQAVSDYVDELAAGTVPDAVPVIGGTTVDPALVVDVILDEVGTDLDPELREQIRAAVASGDERAALTSAAGEMVAARAADAQGELRASLEDRTRLDVVTELADRAGRTKATVVSRLDTVRDAARWFDVPTAVVGVLLMAGALAGLVWSNRRRPRRAALLVAAAAVAAGMTLLALWWVVAGLVDAPLAPATSSGAGSWNLPAGLRALVADVEAVVGDELVETVRRLALVPVAAGAALAAAVALAPRLRVPSARGAVAAGTAAAVLVGVVAVVVPTRVAADDARACNGHPELCERPYDEVVYGATHNSMSSPDVVRIWPEHDGDIRSQLDGGVRALLIDTHHWTALVSDEQLAAGDPFLPAGLAEQVFDGMGPLREERDGTFLCHNHCGLGAIPLLDSLRTIREFLDDNPDEVVTLIVQDAISPEETADAFTEAGLDRYLHEHELGTGWATLGEMIESGERLVVFAEDEGPPPAWYHQAFEHMQETPYLFEEAEDFTCAPNRGDPDATLFLLNHWVQRVAPDRVDAAVVNGHDAIVDRARQCADERGLPPNYIAVNFYSLGELAEAVDTLNDVG